MRGNGDKEQWLLIKERDDDARAEADYDILLKKPGSVLTDSLGARNKKGEITGAPNARRQPGKSRIESVEETGEGHDRPDIVANRNAESLRTLAHEPSVEGAVKAKLPATLKPQLATLVDAAPPGDDWSYEIKFDGYRVLARIDRSASVGRRAGLDTQRQRLDREIQPAGEGARTTGNRQRLARRRSRRARRSRPAGLPGAAERIRCGPSAGYRRLFVRRAVPERLRPASGAARAAARDPEGAASNPSTIPRCASRTTSRSSPTTC